MPTSNLETEVSRQLAGSASRARRRASDAFASDEQRLAAFARALDALRVELQSQIGEEDVRYLRRVQPASNALEIAGRTLLHFSFEPIGFGTRVFALWAHKLLELMAIGHTALHGAHDVTYRSAPWSRRLAEVSRRLRALAFDAPEAASAGRAERAYA